MIFYLAFGNSKRAICKFIRTLEKLNSPALVENFAKARYLMSSTKVHSHSERRSLLALPTRQVIQPPMVNET